MIQNATTTTNWKPKDLATFITTEAKERILQSVNSRKTTIFSYVSFGKYAQERQKLMLDSIISEVFADLNEPIDQKMKEKITWIMQKRETYSFMLMVLLVILTLTVAATLMFINYEQMGQVAMRVVIAILAICTLGFICNNVLIAKGIRDAIMRYCNSAS